MGVDWSAISALQGLNYSRNAALQSEANLNTVRAGLLPAESRANIGLNAAQAAAQNANAATTNAGLPYVGRTDEAAIQEAIARSKLFRSQGSYYGSEAGKNNYDIRRGILFGSTGLSTPGGGLGMPLLSPDAGTSPF